MVETLGQFSQSSTRQSSQFEFLKFMNVHQADQFFPTCVHMHEKQNTKAEQWPSENFKPLCYAWALDFQTSLQKKKKNSTAEMRNETLHCVM